MKLEARPIACAKCAQVTAYLSFAGNLCIYCEPLPDVETCPHCECELQPIVDKIATYCRECWEPCCFDCLKDGWCPDCTPLKLPKELLE